VRQNCIHDGRSDRKNEVRKEGVRERMSKGGKK
jgi:hypothetical protein